VPATLDWDRNQLLNSMETVISGELYAVSFGWQARRQQYLLTAATLMANRGVFE
jgi:hypothetical protein